MKPGAECRPLRVLVVEDSAVQRRMLVALLEADSELDVVGWAANGAEAVAAAARLKPDVITMDLQMPVMDGLEASRRIMRHTPTPIVVVTATATARDRALAQELFEVGVLAIIAKPQPGEHDKTAALLRAVKSVAPLKRLGRQGPGVFTTKPAKLAARPRLVAMGASTGGPQVVQQILTRLPKSFPLPVLLVQHIAPGFEASLIEWLRPLCALPVQLAAVGQRLDVPGIFVAPSHVHLIVRGGQLAFSRDPLCDGHRPSVTVLFRSVAAAYGSGALGVLLTGMGKDGAEGLRDIKCAGGTTVAQDEASSVVFGMPAAAIELGMVDHVLPPAAITALLIELSQPKGAL